MAFQDFDFVAGATLPTGWTDHRGGAWAIEASRLVVTLQAGDVTYSGDPWLNHQFISNLANTLDQRYEYVIDPADGAQANTFHALAARLSFPNANVNQPTQYLVGGRFATTTSFSIEAYSYVAGVFSTIRGATSITIPASTRIRFRVDVTGASPTTLTYTVFNDVTGEQLGQLSNTNSTAELQVANAYAMALWRSGTQIVGSKAYYRSVWVGAPADYVESVYSNLVARFSAKDLEATKVAGDPISAWASSVGTASANQATALEQPTLQYDADGLPYVSFNGDHLDTALGFASPVTYVVLGKFGSEAARFVGSTTGSDGTFYRFNDGINIFITGQILNGGTDPNARATYGATFGGATANSLIRRDGVQLASAARNAVSGTIRLGDDSALNGGIVRLYDVLIFDKALSVAEFEEVEADIQTLWSPPVASATKIMALGDSVTEGDSGEATYRYWLQLHLNAAGYSYDFVGSLNSPRGGGVYFEQGNWDHDHEGIGGQRTDQIQARTAARVTTYTPDIILLQAGVNDLIQGRTFLQVIDGMESIITAARSAKSDIIIFVSLVPPTQHTTETELLTLNTDLSTRLVSLNTVGSPIYIVDQALGFSVATHNYDAYHPNTLGEKRQAMRWADALFEFEGIGAYWTKPQTPVLVQNANLIEWSGDDDELVDQYEVELDGISEATGITTRNHDTGGVVGIWRVRGKRVV